jgi:hypothetical protein
MPLGNVEQLAFFLLLAVAIALAFWQGGAPERWGAGVILAMVLLQAGGESLLPSGFRSVDPSSLMTDAVGTAGFGYLALQARRIWPLWATSLQLLSLSAHFARWADIGIPPTVYAVMRGTPTFLALSAIAVGTILHVWRRRRHGSDPSWQDWSRVALGYGPSRGAYSKPW